MAYVNKFIYCARCGEKREPARKHAIFCAPCYAALEGRMIHEPISDNPSRIFAKQDARLD